MAGLESLLIGRVLGGRYRVEEVIGRGGMGAVYRALDERLGRQVAVKVITAGGGAGPEARERLRARFFREARSAAALPHHPNVVPVYDYGSDEGLGLDYIVMELLRGADLATRLASSQPPPLATSLKILVEAAQGIAVGHRQGLIHRDVKPGNIFLTESHKNEGVQVRVVDFGIAKLADDDDTLGQLTQDGGVPHSPAFASPEQLRGVANLTPASDVFSLGAVAFQLLAGERAFTDADRNQMSLGMPVVPPSLRERNPAIPGAIDAIVRKALAPEPGQRYQDAGEMATALAAAVRSLGDLPIDPYLASSTTLAGTPRGRVANVSPLDEATPVVEPIGDDLTLAAPQAPARPGVAPSAPPRTAAGSASTPSAPPQDATPVPPPAPSAPLRRPSRPSPKRGIGGTLMWMVIVGGLTATGLWVWTLINQDSGPLPEMTGPNLDSLNMALDTSSLLADSLGPMDAFIADQEGIRLYRLGMQSALQMDYAAAQEYYLDAYVTFRRAVQISPESPEFRRNLGFTMLQLRMFPQAVQEIRESLRRDPNPNPPDAFSQLGQAQLAMGDTASAIANLEEYIRRETRPPRRAQIEQILQNVRAARQQPGVELLGEEVTRPQPADIPGTPSTSTPAQQSTPSPNTPTPSGSTVPPSGNGDPARRG